MSTSVSPRRARPPRSTPPPPPAPSDDDGRPDRIARVYQELRDLIIRGQLPPGARIAERTVAARMGLSRTPVRSALHRLQQEGFVASDGRGREQRLIVTPLTQDDGAEIMLMVGHLEGLAARLAAGLPLPQRKSIVARLRAINRSLAIEARRHGPVSRTFELDEAFHLAYIDGVVGPRMLALHRAFKPQAERYARLYVSVLVDEIATSVKEHEVIARAIARGDEHAAQRAVETNWHNAATRLRRVIEQLGERGIWRDSETTTLDPKGKRNGHG